MTSLADLLAADLLAEALEAPAAPRRREWSNAHSFVDEGYLARVVRQTCACCHGVQDIPLGIFHAERAPNGTRRLQALPRGGQWPLSEGLPLELESAEVPFCVPCLRLLGFSVERPAPTTCTLKVPAPLSH